jgi:hypothetical protein
MDCDRDRGSTGAPLANLQRVFEGMAQGLRTMSALLPKADIRRGNRDVRFGPKADSCSAIKISRVRAVN